MPKIDWRPSAPLAHLRRRARIVAEIRAYFAEHDVLEVETPQLCPRTVTDPHLQSIRVPGYGYLQTSPEYAMKRLLASGSGSIYQIARVFRADEVGRLHNPEFTMLEWYRVGFTPDRLIDEVAAIARIALGEIGIVCRSYRDLFRTHFGLDPLSCSLDSLRSAARQQLDLAFDDADRDTWLELLMSQVIEPRLGIGELCFVLDYPPSQAALARLHADADGQAVASRFELYYRGVELANGYHELLDADEQGARFAADLRERELLGLPAVLPDERLHAALAHGLPDCSGVALGLDRLIMLAVGADSLREVMAFPVSHL
ncbi:MAG TPA: EF-P lysine aminoacylase EpmA [Accumulibacter sp.]|uniref:EF-P lysine aminoacylase EpmA n=1 Tax=Accumulibacter sp. TaxID=2053492 RepID=UPI0025F425AD|nr:EF-P lysine aminoacylase EpmA [Accumulibacter sp.]MCM8597922.1 EF-P lysine aminoacylase EpmA [Accumulibacter sp.]MCM8664729.1 EF-P lysine aminoacylase EpmA [Accumulibacter sp.]HNC51161.1 EF-P lysine aminoacylase EpmA [Accumulibacter sp.]